MALFRTKKTYDFRTDFAPTGGKFRHLDRVIDPNLVQAREPRMEDDGTSVVFLPYPDFESGPRPTAVAPDFRDDTDTRSYGDWLLVGPGVRYFGKNSLTLFFDNPDDPGFIPNEHHPVNLVYETAMRAVKTKTRVETPFGDSFSDNWKVLLDGNKDSQPPVYGCLNRPSLLCAAYALVYQCGKDVPQDGVPVGGAAGDRPVVFFMTQNVAQTMFGKLDEYFERNKGVQDVTGNLAVHFFDRKKGFCRAMSAGPVGGGGQLGVRRAAPAGGQQMGPVLGGYEVFVGPNVYGQKRDTYVQHALATVKPWEKVIRTYTPEKCAELLATQSGLPMSLLWAAWKSQPQFITDEMHARARNPVSQNFRAPAREDGPKAYDPADVDPAAPQGYTPPFPGDPFAGGGAAPAFGGQTPAFGAGGPPGNPAPVNDAYPPDGEDYGVDPQKQAEVQRQYEAAKRAVLGGAGVARSQAAGRGAYPSPAGG